MVTEDATDKYVGSLKYGDIIEIWNDVWRAVQKVVFIKIDTDDSILVRPISWDLETVTTNDGEKYAHLVVSKENVILPE